MLDCGVTVPFIVVSILPFLVATLPYKLSMILLIGATVFFGSIAPIVFGVVETVIAAAVFCIVVRMANRLVASYSHTVKEKAMLLRHKSF